MHPTSEGNAFNSWLNDFNEWQVNGVELKCDEDTMMDDSLMSDSFMSDHSFDSVTASSDSNEATSEVSGSLFARPSITDSLHRSMHMLSSKMLARWSSLKILSQRYATQLLERFKH